MGTGDGTSFWDNKRTTVCVQFFVHGISMASAPPIQTKVFKAELYIPVLPLTNAVA